MKKYLLLLLLSASVQAAEKPSPPEPQAKADDISISIHGNQEQPTVMHIVPWQEAGDNKIIQEVNKPPLNDLFFRRLNAVSISAKCAIYSTAVRRKK